MTGLDDDEDAGDIDGPGGVEDTIVESKTIQSIKHSMLRVNLNFKTILN